MAEKNNYLSLFILCTSSIRFAMCCKLHRCTFKLFVKYVEILFSLTFCERIILCCRYGYLRWGIQKINQVLWIMCSSLYAGWYIFVAYTYVGTLCLSLFSKLLIITRVIISIKKETNEGTQLKKKRAYVSISSHIWSLLL